MFWNCPTQTSWDLLITMVTVYVQQTTTLYMNSQRKFHCDSWYKSQVLVNPVQNFKNLKFWTRRDSPDYKRQRAEFITKELATNIFYFNLFLSGKRLIIFVSLEKSRKQHYGWELSMHFYLFFISWTGVMWGHDIFTIVFKET